MHMTTHAAHAERTPLRNSQAIPQEQRSKLVERLFLRMSVLYGNRFADMWEGIDLEEVKKCWADEISAFSIAQIAGAVERLKKANWPPTLPEFLAMCEGDQLKPATTAHLPYKQKSDKYDPNDPEIVAARERCMETARRLGMAIFDKNQMFAG
jgi:hypothetical protein